MKRILAIGRGWNVPLIKYFTTLTGVNKPRVCLLPTATGDHPRWDKMWPELGEQLGFEAHIMPLFISSFDQSESFAEILLSMDAIYVGGGNTVNMLAVWRAQGIDQILHQAWEQGIVLGGGSAGGICWFESGLTDSRPKELTAMSALGWLKDSFAPHYLQEAGRRAYFHKYIEDGSLHNGYGCMETAGMLYEDKELAAIIGSEKDSRVFRVEKHGDKIVEEVIEVDRVVSLA
jgi:dipeptidase E